MHCDNDTRPFYPLNEAAARLGLPASWLRDQAEAGEVPCLIVGRRILISVDAVRDHLLRRAAQAEKGGDCAN